MPHYLIALLYGISVLIANFIAHYVMIKRKVEDGGYPHLEPWDSDTKWIVAFFWPFVAPFLLGCWLFLHSIFVLAWIWEHTVGAVHNWIESRFHKKCS